MVCKWYPGFAKRRFKKIVVLFRFRFSYVLVINDCYNV